MVFRRDYSPEYKKRAEAAFKAKEEKRKDAPQALADYLAEAAAVRERTERLRAQRLAHEAAQAKASAPRPPEST